MFVPVDAKTLEKRPLVGVLLGALVVGMFLVIFPILYSENRGFGPAPQTVDLKTVVAPPQDHGMWVQVNQSLQIHCSAYVERVYGLESLLFGSVREMDYVVQIDETKRVVLLRYDGKMTCKEIGSHPLVGVLYQLNSRRRQVLEDAGLKFFGAGDVIAICGTCGPADSRRTMLMILFMPALGIFVIARYWPKYRAQVKRSQSIGLETGAYAPPPPIG